MCKMRINPIFLPNGQIAMEQSNNLLNYIRSGSIGGVSGVKGGAFAGAMGGMLIMVLNNWGAAGFSFVIYSAIFGATTGMMAGALISYFWGFLTGVVSELIAGGSDMGSTGVALLWYIGFVALAGMVGYLIYPSLPTVGAIGGVVFGLGAATISRRDFIKMVAFQSKSDAEDGISEQSVAER